MKKFTLFLFALLSPMIGFNQTTPGYFMHPDVPENTLVFVAEGDV